MQKNFKMIRQEEGKASAAGALENRRTELTPRKCFRCGYEDHLIAKCQNPPKDNEKRKNQVHFNAKGNHVCDNGKNNSVII